MDLNVRVAGDIVNDENTDEREVVVADASFLMNALNSNLFSPRQLALGMAYQRSIGMLRWILFDAVERFQAPTATLDFNLDLEVSHLRFSTACARGPIVYRYCSAADGRRSSSSGGSLGWARSQVGIRPRAAPYLSNEDSLIISMIRNIPSA